MQSVRASSVVRLLYINIANTGLTRFVPNRYGDRVQRRDLYRKYHQLHDLYSYEAEACQRRPFCSDEVLVKAFVLLLMWNLGSYHPSQSYEPFPRFDYTTRCSIVDISECFRLFSIRNLRLRHSSRA